MAKETKKDKKAKSDKKDNKNFFKEFKAELKKVSWPTLKQLVNNTVAVLAIVLITAVIVFILDVIFENMNKFGVEKLKALVTSSSSESVEADENNDEVISEDGNAVEGNVVEESVTSNEAEETQNVLVEDAETETAEQANTTTENTTTEVVSEQ